MTSSTLTEAVVTGRPAPRRPVTQRRRRARPSGIAPLVLLAPAIVLVAVFAGYPLIRSIWFSLNDVSVFTGVLEFIGFENFATVIGSDDFYPTLGRTAVWTFGAVSLQLVGGLCLALMLNNRFPMRGVYRGLIMIPWATPSVLIALMWKWILDPNNGVLNQWLMGAGVIDTPIEFLSQNSTALPTLIMIDVWQGIPLFAIMILAALQSVSGELKESAQIDGCGPVSVFRHVVLPAILPTILITTLLRLIWTSNYVDLIFILTGGGPGTSSTTLALESYLTTYKASDFGAGAAYAVIQALFLAVFIALYVRLTRKDANR